MERRTWDALHSDYDLGFPRMKVSPLSNHTNHNAQCRRVVGLLAILFATVCSWHAFLGQFVLEHNGSQTGAAMADSVKEQRNPKCRGKERVLGMLQRAVKQSVDEKKCHIPSLLKLSRSSRHVEVKERPVYNKTTCTLSDMCEQLPKWNQIQHNYGGEPVVIGMETCQKYRDSLQGAHPTVRIAGLYNTGTHALAAALQDNLSHLNPNNQTHWDVVWGKHVPLKYRNVNVWGPEDTIVTPDQILPIVVVRDPFRWMQAMVCGITVQGEMSQYCAQTITICFVH